MWLGETSFVRVHALIYNSTTPQTRDKYKTKGDEKAESTKHVCVCVREREREEEDFSNTFILKP